LKQRDTGKATSKEVNKQVTEQSRQVQEAEGRDYIIETHRIKQICQSSGGENKVVKREQSRGRMDKKSQNKAGK
jgi:hypothetical protein